MNNRIQKIKENRKGAMLPLIAVVLIIIFVAAAISVDIARIHVTRAELQTATDAAARAGAEALGREQNVDAARNAARAIAAANEVAGQPLSLRNSQIRIGEAVGNDDGSFQFSQGGGQFTSVQVVGSREDGSIDGSVPTFFGHLLGVDSFEPVLTSSATQTQLDIALVLDTSGSMAIDDRFGSLQLAMNVFLNEFRETTQEERVSLTKYSTTGTKLVDMTGNLNQIENAFARQGPEALTAIGQGMQIGLDSLQNDRGVRPFANKVMVVMTDGNHNTGIFPDVVAQDVADAGFIIHTVTFSNGANQRLMADVANIGGGIHLHAENEQQLIEAFETIARQIKVVLFQ